MSNITVYESNTKGKEAFVKEVLTPVVQQYGYSVASYTGEDGKDEKVWLFKKSVSSMTRNSPLTSPQTA